MFRTLLVCLLLCALGCYGQQSGGQSWPGQGQNGQFSPMGFGGNGGFGGGPMGFGDPIWQQRSLGANGQDPWMQQRAMTGGAAAAGSQGPMGNGQQSPNGPQMPDQLSGRSLVLLTGAAPAAGPPVGQVQDGSAQMTGSGVGMGPPPPWAMNGGAGPFVGSGQSGLGSFVPPQQEHAMAVLTGNSGVRGVLFFTQTPWNLTISGSITGLSPGAHGLHIHEFGSTSNGCLDAGDHFNPMNRTHGGPADAPNRHVGDLGNVVADAQGTATVNVQDPMVTLSPSPGVIAGRAIVIHEKMDDLGKGNDAQSRVDGNSGARLACGVVVFSKRP